MIFLFGSNNRNSKTEMMIVHVSAQCYLSLDFTILFSVSTKAENSHHV